jgi:hypothetical protein
VRERERERKRERERERERERKSLWYTHLGIAEAAAETTTGPILAPLARKTSFRCDSSA